MSAIEELLVLDTEIQKSNTYICGEQATRQLTIYTRVLQANLKIIKPLKSNPANPTQTIFSNFLVFSFASKYVKINPKPLKSNPQNSTLKIVKVSKCTHTFHLIFCGTFSEESIGLSQSWAPPSTEWVTKACWWQCQNIVPQI